MSSKQELIVVGIGSSAGGIEPLRDLLEEAHCNKSLAFVLVPHVARDYTSRIPEILAKTVDLPWCTIEDGMEIEACRMYFIPSDKWVEVRANKFKLLPRPGSGSNQSADVLLKSLAREYGRKAVGIVLSGAPVGQDGTEGLKAIHAAHGITIAQDPSTAAFTGMPEAAIASGSVDHVYSPPQIGSFLSSLAFEAAAVADAKNHKTTPGPS